MSRISVRIPRALRSKLEEASKDASKSLSEYIRIVLESHVGPVASSSWKISLWNLLGVDIARTNYALSRSSSVEEFFSYIGKAVKKDIMIRPNSPKDGIDLDFVIDDVVYNVQQEKRTPFAEALVDFIDKLEDKIMEDYDGEV